MKLGNEVIRLIGYLYHAPLRAFVFFVFNLLWLRLCRAGILNPAVIRA